MCLCVWFYVCLLACLFYFVFAWTSFITVVSVFVAANYVVVVYDDTSAVEVRAAAVISVDSATVANAVGVTVMLLLLLLFWCLTAT